VRTQHHWYLDPVYPALAMLAAGSALFLVRRAPARLRAAALLGLVLIPVALCEARILGRIVLKEPMRADQRFLAALKDAPGSGAARACRSIRTTCRLAYSERFLLEVADGFEVVEPAAAAAPATAGGPTSGACLLVGKAAWRRPPPPSPDRLPAGGLLLADSSSFALYREPTREPRPARP
jgi:hypothetical protein